MKLLVLLYCFSSFVSLACLASNSCCRQALPRRDVMCMVEQLFYLKSYEFLWMFLTDIVSTLCSLEWGLCTKKEKMKFGGHAQRQR